MKQPTAPPVDRNTDAETRTSLPWQARVVLAGLGRLESGSLTLVVDGVPRRLGKPEGDGLEALLQVEDARAQAGSSAAPRAARIRSAAAMISGGSASRPSPTWPQARCPSPGLRTS